MVQNLGIEEQPSSAATATAEPDEPDLSADLTPEDLVMKDQEKKPKQRRPRNRRHGR
jgi:hypothetical protein